MKTAAWLTLGTILIIILIVSQFDPVPAAPEPLSNHPGAQWSGGVDGGAYFEIISAEPPRYFLQIRHQSGSLWAEGWITEVTRNLNSADFWAYDGGSNVVLKNGQQVILENRDGRPISNN